MKFESVALVTDVDLVTCSTEEFNEVLRYALGAAKQVEFDVYVYFRVGGASEEARRASMITDQAFSRLFHFYSVWYCACLANSVLMSLSIIPLLNHEIDPKNVFAQSVFLYKFDSTCWQGFWAEFPVFEGLEPASGETLPTEYACNPIKNSKIVESTLIAGTFDFLHGGHRLILT